jgi:hypothetical protein
MVGEELAMTIGVDKNRKDEHVGKPNCYEGGEE